MMEQEDDNQEILEEVRRYEDMVHSGKKQWFDADEYIDIIDYYHDNGKMKEANKVINLAYKIFPDNEELIIRISQLYSNKKMFLKAENILRNTLKKQPSTDIYSALASLYIENGREDDGIKILKEIIRKKDDDDDFVIKFLFGKAYLNKKKWISAEKYLKEALKEDLDYDVLNMYIDCSADKRLKKRMIEFMTYLIKEQPYDDNIWMVYGIIQYQFNNLNEAINAIDYAIAINEKDFSRHYYKGLILHLQDKKEEALNAFLLANKYNQNDCSALYEIATIYKDTNKYQLAIATYKDILEKGGDDISKEECYFNISFCYYMLGKEKLGDKYEQMADEECYDTDFKLSFAKSMYLNGFIEQSENIFEELLVDEDDDVVVQSTISLAYLYKDDDKILQAIQVIKDSINNVMSSQISLYYCLLDISSCDENLYKYSTSLLVDIMHKFKVSATTINKRCPNLKKNKKLLNYIKSIIKEND